MEATEEAIVNFEVGDKCYGIGLRHDGKWGPRKPMTVGSASVEARPGGKMRARFMCEETGVGSGSVYYADDYYKSEEDAQVICNLRNEIMAAGPEGKPKIYCFVNGGRPGWYDVIALHEDGNCLAGHACSAPCWGPHDMGVTSDWKHETYWKFYPEGFVLEWVEDPKGHEGLRRALELNKKQGEKKHD